MNNLRVRFLKEDENKIWSNTVDLFAEVKKLSRLYNIELVTLQR